MESSSFSQINISANYQPTHSYNNPNWSCRYSMNIVLDAYNRDAQCSPFVGQCNPNERYSAPFTPSSKCHVSMRDFFPQQNQEIFNANQLLFQDSFATHQPSPYDENAMPHMPYNPQLATQSAANAEELTIDRAEVRKFEIIEISNSCDVFLNSYSFIGIEHNEGKWHLCVDMAKYDELKGERLKKFTQMLEENISIDKTDRGTVKRENMKKGVMEKYCPLNHERLKFQKRQSKKKNKNTWFSCSKRYNISRRLLKANGNENAGIKEMLRVEESLFHLERMENTDLNYSF